MSDKLNICGNRIKAARVECNMQQVDLAAAITVDFNLEMSQNSISDLERGERHVKDTELLAFAEILDKHPMWLLFGNKTPDKYK